MDYNNVFILIKLYYFSLYDKKVLHFEILNKITI